MENQFDKTGKLILAALAAVVVCLGLAGLGVIAFVWPFAKPLPYLLGLLAGGGLSWAKLLLLKRSLGRTIDLESGQAQNVTRLHFILRHLLTAVVLVGVVLLRDYVDLIGTLLGILSLQLAAYAAAFIERREEERRFAIHGTPPPLPPEDDDEPPRS